MRFIAWSFSAVAALMLLIAVASASWVAMASTLTALLLVLPPIWRKTEHHRFGGGTRGALATALLIVGLGAAMFTVNNSPEGRALAAETQRLGRHCLASDGSPERLVGFLKSMMGNPNSFEHVATTIEPVDAAGQHRVELRYRAENRFGGMDLNFVEATLDSDDCEVTSIS